MNVSSNFQNGNPQEFTQKGGRWWNANDEENEDAKELEANKKNMYEWTLW